MFMRKFTLLLCAFLGVSYLFGAEPTVAPSNGKAGSVQCDKATISWTNGNGGWRLVLVKKGSAVDALPQDGTSYTGFNTFTAGDEIGSGNYGVRSSICFHA